MRSPIAHVISNPDLGALRLVCAAVADPESPGSQHSRYESDHWSNHYLLYAHVIAFPLTRSISTRHFARHNTLISTSVHHITLKHRIHSIRIHRPLSSNIIIVPPGVTPELSQSFLPLPLTAISKAASAVSVVIFSSGQLLYSIR